jgi:uncharacterized membrane protein SirB2
MSFLVFTLFFHFIGLGLISASLVGGWILNNQYKRATDWKVKLAAVQSLRPIGLLSPISIAILLLSGIGNMEMEGLGLFSATWLSAKLFLFLIAVVTGVIFGGKASRRAKLVAQIAGGKGPEDAEPAIRALDRQQQLFYVLNSVLILAILILSIAKPG